MTNPLYLLRLLNPLTTMSMRHIHTTRKNELKRKITRSHSWRKSIKAFRRLKKVSRLRVQFPIYETITRHYENIPPHLFSTTNHKDVDTLSISKTIDKSIVSQSKNPTIDETIHTSDHIFKDIIMNETFQQYQLHPTIHKAIMSNNYTIPTLLQTIAIPEILKGKSILLVGESGSGKTAAYTIPLLSRLLETDTQQLAPYPGSPRFIVLTPTQELVEQTGRAIRSIGKWVIRGTTLCQNGKRLLTEGKELLRGYDTVVCTPQRLITHFKRGEIRFNRLFALVVDEADIMCVPPMEKELFETLQLIRIRHLRSVKQHKIISNIQEFVKELPTNLCELTVHEKETINLRQQEQQHTDNSHTILSEHNTDTQMLYDKDIRPLPQTIFVTAAKTGGITSFLKRHLQSMLEPIISPSAHTITPQIRQVFVPIKDKTRIQCLTEVLQEVHLSNTPVEEKLNLNGGDKTIIFTKSVKCCIQIYKKLKEIGYTSVMLHGDLPVPIRRTNYKIFVSGQISLLIATDLASRGLNIQGVGNVIMYNLPKNAPDYIHRVGRVARGGAPGRVTCLYSCKDHSVLKEVQAASRIGRPLEVISPSKRLKQSLMAIKNWQLDAVKREKQKLQSLDLYKRGLIPKTAPFPTLPNKQIEASETRSYIKMIRGADGILQAIPMPKKEFKTLKSKIGKYTNFDKATAKPRGANRPAVSPETANILMQQVKTIPRRNSF